MSDPLTDLAALEGVPSAIAASRSAVDVVLRDRGRRTVSGEQSAAGLIAGARASAELESALSDDPAVDWAAGAARLQTELLSLAALVTVSPGQVLARAHTLVAREVAGDAAGRLRDDPVVAARMVGLNALLTRSGRTPAIVLAAVVHAELATVRPFGVADGIVARAVEHMVLVTTGLDPQAALVPEAGHLLVGPEYAVLLAGYAEGSVTGVRDWILHCARAVAHGAEVSPLARPSAS